METTSLYSLLDLCESGRSGFPRSELDAIRRGGTFDPYLGAVLTAFLLWSLMTFDFWMSKWLTYDEISW